tara:strand:- start:364 stop:501 length:138 start_codon:yes stop_codon:yes gene_type:complete
MDPRDKIFAFIFSGLILLVLLSLFMILSGASEPMMPQNYGVGLRV